MSLLEQLKDEPDWFKKWMTDPHGRTPEECGEPVTVTVREDVCPLCGAWEPKAPACVPYVEKEFTLKHRDLGGRRRHVNLTGKLWQHVSKRAYDVLISSKTNNLKELKEEIADGRLTRWRNCGPKTARELKELVRDCEHEAQGTEV